VYLLERRGPLDLGDLPLLAPLDAGGGGVQGIVGGQTGLLVTPGRRGCSATGTRAVEGCRRSHWRERRGHCVYASVVTVANVTYDSELIHNLPKKNVVPFLPSFVCLHYCSIDRTSSNM